MSRMFRASSVLNGVIQLNSLPTLVILAVLCALGIDQSIFAQGAKNVLIDQATPGESDINPQNVIKWEAVGATASDDGRIIVSLRLITLQEFTIYQDKVKFTPPPSFTLQKMATPPTKTLIDPVMNKEVEVYYGGEFELEYIGPQSEGIDSFTLSISYVGCTSRICLFPYDEIKEIPVVRQQKSAANSPVAVSTPDPSPPSLSENGDLDSAVTTEQAPPPQSETRVMVGQIPPPATLTTPNEDQGVGLETSLVKRMEGKDLSIGLLLFFAFLGGVLTNLTPCVYPMIPITIRVLARQGKSPILASASYSAGILITYTALGIFASLTGSLFGSMMASPTFNLIFAAIMFVFGLTMLGYGDLSILQNLGNRMGSGRASMKNAFLMGTGAGLVASPCTGPVLAFLLGYSATKGDLMQGIILLFTYSLGFALPYVFLGGAAARAAAIKVHPRVQVGIKTSFAAVMFALAFYYLRIPAYSLLTALAPYWQGLTIVGLTSGLIVGAMVFLTPRRINQKSALALPALLVGVGIFSGSQWLATRHKTTNGKAIVWMHSEEAALKLAKERNLPVFIDNWAEWCEACKKMDSTTFTDPTVIDALGSSSWVLLKNDLTESNDENDKLMEKYEIRSLPTFILLKRGGTLQDKVSILGYATPAELLNRIQTFEVE